MIKRNFILAIILVLLVSSFSYGEGNSQGDKIAYQNNLLKEENQKLRRNLLDLRLKLTNERSSGIPVLLYHHIATQEDIEEYGWEDNSSIVSVNSFSEQMEYLNDNNYYTATLEELELFIDGELELPRNTVVITFDDGYLSNVEYAYPIMKSYGFKGSIFMVGQTSMRDESGLAPGELLHIPGNDVYKYEDVFEFGCHTFGLHDKNGEGIPLLQSSSKEEVVADLTKNLELFNTKYMAYPYGSYNQDNISQIQELGYTMAFTVNHGYIYRGSSRFELDRIVISPKTSIKQFQNFISIK